MRSCATAVSAIVIVSCIGCAPKRSAEAERAAIQCANTWLALVDTGKYAASWEETAEFFRNTVAKEKWEETAKALRAPLGQLVSRELKARRYTTSAPDAPDGQYVIIQYKTNFENKASAIETVTPMLDKDGKWRVSGYYIK